MTVVQISHQGTVAWSRQGRVSQSLSAMSLCTALSIRNKEKKATNVLECIITTGSVPRVVGTLSGHSETDLLEFMVYE